MRRNMRQFIAFGVAAATIYSVYAMILFAFRGAAPFQAHGTTLVMILLTYYTAGIIGGALLGALVPLTRSLPGLIAVVTLVAWLVYVCTFVTLKGPFWTWSAEQWMDSMILGLLIGPVVGVGWWKIVLRK